MHISLSRPCRSAWLKRLLGAAASVAIACAGSVFAHAEETSPAAQDAARNGTSLLGTWLVDMTLYDCKTGVPRPPFQSLLAFMPGGVEIETTSNPALQPAQRTPAFGSWSYAGHRTFLLKTEAFILFSSMQGAPVPRGKQVILQSIKLTGAASFESVASVAYFDAAEQLMLSGCAKASAVRL